jgi:hypothetical protein
MKRLLTVAMLLMVGISISGCMQKTVTPESAGPTEAASPAAAYRFEDLPVPATMNLIRSDSYIFESGGFRAGILVYEGKDDPAELVKYYRENMPQHNWKLTSVFEHEQANLVFQKPGWNCNITISKSAVPMQPTRLTILIGPVEAEKKA